MNGNIIPNSYLIVFNPIRNNKRQQIITLVEQQLFQKKFAFERYATSPSLLEDQQFFDKNSHKFTDVIVIGGDGTFHNVINCLPLEHKLKVGIVPAGTGNDFARSWYGKQHKDLDHIIDVVTSTNIVSISLGECQFEQKEEGNQQRRLFHNVMGTGFDSLLAKTMHQNKSMFKSLSYFVAVIKHIPFYREQPCSVTIEGKTKDYQNLITAFANNQYFGAGLHVAPRANPETNDLDIIQVAKFPLFIKLGLIIKLCFGKHLSASQVRYQTSKTSSKINTAGLDLQADGEYIGQSPCLISVIENAIKIKR